MKEKVSSHWAMVFFFFQKNKRFFRFLWERKKPNFFLERLLDFGCSVPISSFFFKIRKTMLLILLLLSIIGYNVATTDYIEYVFAISFHSFLRFTHAYVSTPDSDKSRRKASGTTRSLHSRTYITVRVDRYHGRIRVDGQIIQWVFVIGMVWHAVRSKRIRERLWFCKFENDETLTNTYTQHKQRSETKQFERYDSNIDWTFKTSSFASSVQQQSFGNFTVLIGKSWQVGTVESVQQHTHGNTSKIDGQYEQSSMGRSLE